LKSTPPRCFCFGFAFFEEDAAPPFGRPMALVWESGVHCAGTSRAVAGPGFWGWVLEMYRDIKNSQQKKLIFDMYKYNAAWLKLHNIRIENI